MDDKPASKMLDLTWADATVLSYSIGNVILLPFKDHYTDKFAPYNWAVRSKILKPSDLMFQKTILGKYALFDEGHGKMLEHYSNKVKESLYKMMMD